MHCLQEKIEKATFCKDYVRCQQPIYIMLQVDQSDIFLFYTLKYLRALLTLGGYNGKIEEDMF